MTEDLFYYLFIDLFLGVIYVCVRGRKGEWVGNKEDWGERI